MQAWQIHRFGGPEVLTLDEIEQPVAGHGEVLVRIAATSINPVDYKTREGSFPVVKESDLPFILGRDVAGTVEADGAGFKAGERVYAMPAFERGTYARYVVLKADEVARLPAHVDMELAGGAPLAALTAWQGLFDQGHLKAGERVLVLGAPGGVGHLAVQFAKNAGATVFATGRGKDRRFAESLGVDRFIDTEAESLDVIGKPVDLVYDLLGPKAQAEAWKVIKAGGRFVSTLQEPDAGAAGTANPGGVKTSHYMARPSGAQLEQIAQLMAEGKVRVHEQRRFSFDKLPDAHRALENEHTQGKIIVTVP